VTPLASRRARLSAAAIALALAWSAASASARAGAEAKHVLRFATVAPDGSGWAREIRAFSREVEQRTKGAVAVKVYYGGVAGDELEVAARIERGQLDGTASGGMLCSQAMPSMKVLSVQGVFQDRDEAAYAMDQLSPTLEAEARAAGYELLGFAGLGPSVIFSREPIRSMDDLRSTRAWRWDLHEMAIAMGKEMGLSIVPAPLEEAARAYADGRVDAFIAIPTAALAFQWFSQVKYLTKLPVDYLSGCLLITTSSLDALTEPQRRLVREASAKLMLRIEELGRRQDEQLLGGVFEKQGLVSVPVSAAFRAEFFEAARTARGRIDESIVDPKLIKRVLKILADYRAEHD